METFILKTVICSGILFGLYHWFLAKEKTFVFNRFYLIFSVIFSLTIPFLTIELPNLKEEKSNLIIGEEIPQEVFTQQITEESSFDFSQIFLAVYCLIAVLFLAKFIFSILKIKNLKGGRLIYRSKNIVLLQEDLAPFSFWNTIYISEKSFSNSGIDSRVFMHEEIHIQQKHSLDLIFIELTKAVLWINPFFYFYKSAMVNNHEFLADEEVINKNINIKNYQELILQEVLKQQNIPLTHHFNFNNTKKRFIMMTKQNSKFAKAKKFLAVPVFAIAAFVFAEKVYGNGTAENLVLDLKKTNIVDFKENNASLNEYLKMSEKYDDIIKARDFERFEKEVPMAEKKKFIELFDKINISDRGKIPFWIRCDEISNQIPTQNQLNQFLDSKYKITVNNHAVDNNILKNYKNTDFYYVYILKIYPKNPDYGKYDYGVILYTKAFAKKYNSAKNITVSFKVDMAEYKQWVQNDTIAPKKRKETKAEIKKIKPEDINVNEYPPVAMPKPVQTVEQTPAEYPGGMDLMRKGMGENFNPTPFEKLSGTVKASILISVDENGKTTDIKVTGPNSEFNKEAYRVTELMTAGKIWKPATENGKPAKSVYKLPLAMKFENTAPIK